MDLTSLITAQLLKHDFKFSVLEEQAVPYFGGDIGNRQNKTGETFAEAIGVSGE